MNTSRSRSNHGSKPTCCPLVAQYPPGRFRPPHDHRNGWIGTDSYRLAHTKTQQATG
ncbi:hypothetical protein [Streptomyces armeniacus]|uniref:hypothetical protein n=1 Tax=Streptomyces armeniacus TaxID=83291 RepID=UPI001AD80BDC|nr:hypothetical protein [Streptomyces armeniacus]